MWSLHSKKVTNIRLCDCRKTFTRQTAELGGGDTLQIQKMLSGVYDRWGYESNFEIMKGMSLEDKVV